MMDVYPELYPLWEEALRAKHYGECEPYGEREYKKLLGDFNVSSNFPGTLVAEDLIKAFPNAKVILTTRDVDSWLHSMKNSVDKGYQWRSFDWIAPWEPVSRITHPGHIIGTADDDKGGDWTVVEVSLLYAQAPASAGPPGRATGLY